MVKVFEFQAPESMRLTELTPERAEEVATKLAEEGLDRLGDIRPVGVQAVALSRIETEVWVQWTRACCDKRHLIEEFEEPVVADLDVPDTRLPLRMHNTHLESQMRSVRLQGADHVDG